MKSAMDGEEDGAKDPQTSLTPVVSEVTARLLLSAHGTRTDWKEIRVEDEYWITKGHADGFNPLTPNDL
jgi:hypothetical protein